MKQISVLLWSASSCLGSVPELSDHQEIVQHSYPSRPRSAQQTHSAHPKPSDFELTELSENRDIVHPAPARNSSSIEPRSFLLDLVIAFALDIRYGKRERDTS